MERCQRRSIVPFPGFHKPNLCFDCCGPERSFFGDVFTRVARGGDHVLLACERFEQRWREPLVGNVDADNGACIPRGADAFLTDERYNRYTDEPCPELERSFRSDILSSSSVHRLDIHFNDRGPELHTRDIVKCGRFDIQHRILLACQRIECGRNRSVVGCLAIHHEYSSTGSANALVTSERGRQSTHIPDTCVEFLRTAGHLQAPAGPRRSFYKSHSGRFQCHGDVQNCRFSHKQHHILLARSG